MNIPVNTSTIARVLAIVIGSFALATAVPAVGDSSSATRNLSIVIIFGIVAITLLTQAASRRKRLFDAIGMELNKLRRLYHISKNLSVASPERYRSWFTELHGFLQAYLMMFAGKDFSIYDSSNAAFRKLSYHVYTIPLVETKKEEALFEDLLRTAATIAESRQHIKELWDSRMSGYLWTIIFLLAGGYIFTTLLAMDDSFIARMSGGATIAAGLLVVDFIWALDSLATDGKPTAKRYADNLARLELGHRQ